MSSVYRALGCKKGIAMIESQSYKINGQKIHYFNLRKVDHDFKYAVKMWIAVKASKTKFILWNCPYNIILWKKQMWNA